MFVFLKKKTFFFFKKNDILKKIKKFEGILTFFGVFVKEIVIFNIGFGFVVLKSIW